MTGILCDGQIELMSGKEESVLVFLYLPEGIIIVSVIIVRRVFFHSELTIYYFLFKRQF